MVTVSDELLLYRRLTAPDRFVPLVSAVITARAKLEASVEIVAPVLVAVVQLLIQSPVPPIKSPELRSSESFEAAPA